MTLSAHHGPDRPPVPACELVASCAPGDHTYSWPCEYAPGTGALAWTPEELAAARNRQAALVDQLAGHEMRASVRHGMAATELSILLGAHPHYGDGEELPMAVWRQVRDAAVHAHETAAQLAEARRLLAAARDRELQLERDCLFIGGI